MIISLLQCSQNYTKQDCEELSIRKYKGHPRSSNLFDSNCGTYTLKYSQKQCQKAFVELSMGKNKDQLKDKFGSKIIECFTSSDLKRFLKK